MEADIEPMLKMAGYPSGQHVATEEPRLFGGCWIDDFQQQRLQFPAKPVVGRDVEPDLLTVDDFRRQLFLHQTL